MISFLLVLIFLSKISFACLGIFPKQLEPFIYQYGMHPYVNIALNILVGGFVGLKWLHSGNRLYHQSRFYRLLLFLTIVYLVLITFLQMFLVHSEESLLLQFAAALMAGYTLWLYGRVIPTVFQPERFVVIVKNATVFLCTLSFLFLFLSPATSFKGTRFIGIFKHIPHMVSCATLACFGLYYSLFAEKLRRSQIIFYSFLLALCFVLLVLTGTRSALAAVILGFFICLVIFRTSSKANFFLKASLTVTFLLVFMFFGHDIADYAVGVMRGEKSIASRTAQDGFKSRLEEVERGFEIFKKDQWLGQGILSKFSTGPENQQEAELSGYNANKDPHNIFISAGVVGGWGLILLTVIGLCALVKSVLSSLLSKNKAIKLLAVYMLTHIPIILIYHVHLSLGGIADRIYWIVVGYLAVNEIDFNKAKEPQHE